MANKANLPNRVRDANAAQRFASIQKFDKEGRPRVIVVPGHNSAQYHVIIRRDGQLTTELSLLVNGQLVKPPHVHQVTYHVMAACQICADVQGCNLVWCANEQDAHNLSNLGGKVFKVSAFKNPTSVMWGVMRKE